MTEPKGLTLTKEAWEAISCHAAETYPEECCGVIIFNDPIDEVIRCTNIQNNLHALDPDTYPRNARIAYAMDYRELESIVQEANRAGRIVKAFYHSHPEHGAYFSEEDKSFACPFGEPTFPESAQIVISIYDSVVKEISAYSWSEQKMDFIQIPLRAILPP
jgi:proteasome lid subunit RPN8/RPN11